ncbi:hypothetical protein U5A82_01505 [Sphingobium sp. CR2-8]|uniref:hypothetical protein n=1 Tax=Sphingobium sp. CR2-8 TaxID=1306534 RepID=UPI002DBD308F|nr:hypothetical protein [Sphingobium sp. CR2-8]MEC3909193.1 hypothetical protein [Sphingobium sp. CR2-8]
MIDCDILQLLAAQNETIQMRHNAHHDSHTTVARHLLHRERIGEHVYFASEQARSACIETGDLWELSVRNVDGEETHLAAPSLGQCLLLAQSVFYGVKKTLAA